MSIKNILKYCLSFQNFLISGNFLKTKNSAALTISCEQELLVVRQIRLLLARLSGAPRPRRAAVDQVVSCGNKLLWSYHSSLLELWLLVDPKFYKEITITHLLAGKSKLFIPKMQIFQLYMQMSWPMHQFKAKTSIEISWIEQKKLKSVQCRLELMNKFA